MTSGVAPASRLPIAATATGRAMRRVGGISSNAPNTELARPGITTRTAPSATSALSVASSPEEERPFSASCRRRMCRAIWEPATASPTANVASTASTVQPNPMVDTRATSTASSTKRYTPNNRFAISGQRTSHRKGSSPDPD